MDKSLKTKFMLSAGMALAAAMCAPQTAIAQTATDYRNVDENGVDLTHGDFVMSFEEGSIGSGEAKLSLIRKNAGTKGSQWHNIYLVRRKYGNSITIEITQGAVRETFIGTILTSNFSSTKANGATLTRSGYSHTYHSADGTSIVFNDPSGGDAGFDTGFCSVFSDNSYSSSCVLFPETVTSPNGASVNLEWVWDWAPGANASLSRVWNSKGYSITFSGNRAEFRNENVSSAVQGTVSYAYPGAGAVDVTDMAGNTWRITATSIRRPGETTPGFTVSGQPMSRQQQKTALPPITAAQFLALRQP